jgi:hypothetical protein
LGINNKILAVAILLTLLSCVVIISYIKDDEHQHVRIISRDYDNETEQEIGNIVENLNYSDLLNISSHMYEYSCFDGLIKEAKFIDIEVIQYYWNLVGDFEQNKTKSEHSFEYSIDVYFIKKIDLEIGHKCYINTIPTKYSSTNILGHDVHFYINTDSSLILYDGQKYAGCYEYNIANYEFNTSYLADMYLEWDGRFWIEQKVFLDLEFQIKLIVHEWGEFGES